MKQTNKKKKQKNRKLRNKTQHQQAVKMLTLLFFVLFVLGRNSHSLSWWQGNITKQLCFVSSGKTNKQKPFKSNKTNKHSKTCCHLAGVVSFHFSKPHFLFFFFFSPFCFVSPKKNKNIRDFADQKNRPKANKICCSTNLVLNLNRPVRWNSSFLVK